MIRDNPIPPWRAALRKLATVVTVARRELRAPDSAEELVYAVDALRDSALQAPDLHRTVLGLWRIEGTVFSFFDNRREAMVSLAELPLPLEVGPPAHCGLAMAIVLSEGFDPQRVLARFENLADPAFINFCHGTLGLMLGIYERDLPGIVAGGLGKLGLIRHRPLERPPLSDFLDSLPDERLRLAAHGYGRAQYFKRFRLAAAVTQIEGTPKLPTSSAVRGMISAKVLINCSDLIHLVGIHASGESDDVIDGIEGGLFNALSLLEWSAPGCLGGLNGSTRRTTELIRRAEHRAGTARDQGLGPPLEA